MTWQLRAWWFRFNYQCIRCGSLPIDEFGCRCPQRDVLRLYRDTLRLYRDGDLRQ